MKISCQSCQAKYTIADEKVVGKIVKIRCKKCGATIVINGNEDATAASAQAGGGAGVADYTAQGDEPWTVNVAEGDQRTMSVQEIAQEFRTGVITDDTYCWKDGMNDWLPLREIESLYSAVTLGPPPALQTNADGFSPLSLSPAPGGSAPDQETVANVNFGLFGGGTNGGGTENTRTDVSNGSSGSLFGSGSSPPAAAASSTASSSAATGAARRTGGRGQGGADLFGSAAQAGGENDVLTSAATANAGAAASNDASKMTGARNENSVLFSLNALTNEPSKPSGGGGGHGGGGGGGGGLGGPGAGGGRGDTSATGDGSGLIDIRALAQSMGVENGGKSGAKVDDIMNLSGGGAFSAALAAPVLAPPPADYSADMSSPEGQKNKTTLIAIIGGALFLGVCILGAAFMFSGGKDKDDDAKASPATSETVAAPTQTVAAAPTETTPPTAATPPGTQATAPTTGGAVAHNTGGGSKPSSAKAAGGTGGGTPAADPTPAPAPAAAKPKSLAEAMQSAGGGGAAPKPEAASAGGSAPFDRGAAAAALGGVNAASCKKPDGPTGPGKVKVTFEPNGSVSKVEFAEGPYGGTPVGGCILGKFRGARIPAFSGAAVTAGKSFSIN